MFSESTFAAPVLTDSAPINVADAALFESERGPIMFAVVKDVADF